MYRVTPYSDTTRLAPAEAPSDTAIPRRVGDPSPIKHVFYVIRENRTYDQILGDLGRGNGDPTLALFGETITPNAHALAREFVTLDNFYVDAEVSYDGHAFSTGAYRHRHRGEDVAHQLRQPRRGLPQRRRRQDAERIRQHRGADERLHLGRGPPRRQDRAQLRGVRGRRRRRRARSSPPCRGSRATWRRTSRSWDLKIPDNTRIDAWLEEFKKFEADGNLPALSIVRLPNDHTNGLSGGFPTPRAMIAENDLALGRLVDIISHSKYWNESAIFVLEDDAQNGPDHVDAHRSPAFVVSPYVKRGTVDSTLYTTSGMLRTMELILGVPPMSQYDAAGHADVQRLHQHARAGAVHQARRARAAQRDERRHRPGRPGLGSDELRGRGHDAGNRAERNPLALDPRPDRRHAAARHAAFIKPVLGLDTDDWDDDDDAPKPATPAKPIRNGSPGGSAIACLGTSHGDEMKW